MCSLDRTEGVKLKGCRRASWSMTGLSREAYSCFSSQYCLICLCACICKKVHCCFLGISCRLALKEATGKAWKQQEVELRDSWHFSPTEASEEVMLYRHGLILSLFTNTGVTCSFQGDTKASSVFCIYLLSIRIVFLQFYSVTTIKWPLLCHFRVYAVNENEQSEQHSDSQGSC